jgi:hypothetical protein
VALDNSTGPTRGRVYVTSGNSEKASIFAYGPTAPADTLALAKTGVGAGTVKSEPAGIACGTACTAEYNVGEAVTLTAVPDPGSALAGWSVNGSPATCPGTGACQLSLSSDTEVIAEFNALPPQTLTAQGVAAAVNGAVSVSATATTATGLKLARPSVSGRAATLEATVPSVGVLSASGEGLSPIVGSPVTSGHAALHLRLNSAGVRALRRAKRRRLKVRVTVTFTPNSGGATTALTRTVTFKAKNREKR